MAKIKEFRTLPQQGRDLAQEQTRVIVVDAVPEGAVQVDDNSPETDWEDA